MPVLSKPLDELCREGQLLTSGQGREVYAVSYEGIRAPMIVKHLSIPATQAMVQGLIYSGAVADEQAALAYYSAEMDELRRELSQLDSMRDHPHFMPYLDSYIKEKTDGVGYDVYLLTLRAETVRDLMAQRSFSPRSALELGVSAAEALCSLRLNGLLHRDIHPGNLYLDAAGAYRMGDLGVLRLDELQYATQPERYICEYTAPELCSVLGEPNETVDCYALGMVLWTIFNGYEPPFDGDEERRREAADLPAPQYASEAVAQVLCRACAPLPADRYESPAELLDALESLIADADDTPILSPLPKSEDEAVSAEEDPAQAPDTDAAPADAPTAEPSDDAADNTAADNAPEEASDEAADVSADEEAGDKADGEALDDTFGTGLGRSMDAVAVKAADEAAEPAEAADTEPANTAAEPAEDAEADDDPVEVSYLEGRTMANIQLPPLPEPSQRFQTSFAAAYEDEKFPDELTVDPSRVHVRSRLWLKILIPVVVLALLAGAAFSGVYYLRHRAHVINALTLQLEDRETMSVSIDAPEDALLTVILTDDADRVLQSLPYNGEALRFGDLNAGTRYNVRLQSRDDRALDGVLNASISTPEPTQLLSFHATALSPTEIALEFTSTGYEPDHWTLTFSNVNGESQTASFTGHSLNISGLDSGQLYSFTITDDENQPVLGTSTVTCETDTVVNLATFELDDSKYGELTVRWTSTGNYAKVWKLTCSGSDGAYRAEDITLQGNSFSYTLEDLPVGCSYEVTLDCEGLTNPQDAVRSIDLPLCTVTNFTAYALDTTTIQASWSFIDGEQPERWCLNCTNVGTGETQVYSVAENSFNVTGLLPNAEYRFELSAENGLLVGGCTPVSARTPTAGKFTDYKTSGIFLGFFVLPNKDNWVLSDLVTSTREFSTAGGMAFAVEVSYEVTKSDKHVDTLYIIRNSEGSVVDYKFGALDWPGNSVTETHYGGFEKCPGTAGEYTLEIYFNGDLLTSKTFQVF